MPKITKLTATETEALNLLLEGHRNKVIGNKMKPPRTEGSVKNILTGVYEKTGFKNRSELIAHYKN